LQTEPLEVSHPVSALTTGKEISADRRLHAQFGLHDEVLQEHCGSPNLKFKECERAHLSASRTPLPSRMVSDGEYMPFLQSAEQKPVDKKSLAWQMQIQNALA
jgi:hypothetical protein